MSTFAVVTPSRGLVHSRTVEAVMAAIAAAAGHEFRGWRLSHDLPIPDCHEAVTVAGLATGADYLWFVEEDVIPPADTLARSLALGAPFVALDYPVNDWSCIARNQTGRIEWAGLGATLIAREVFERLERPWFRSDISYSMIWQNGQRELKPLDVPMEYGGQDIHFSRRALAAGFEIVQLPGIARHARVRALGAAGTNHGAHAIDILDRFAHEAVL